MSETWTDDDRFFLVERLREKQRAYYSCQDGRKRALLGECKALEARVDLMLSDRKKPAPQKNLFGEEF
jgi:hypothetical protein